MVNRNGFTRRIELEPLEVRKQQLLDYQKHWYVHCTNFCRNLSILDVGAGTGYGVRILRPFASEILGIDPAPSGPDVLEQTVEGILDDSYDLVTAIDIIEHADDDRKFLKELLRVARQYVFFTTPNYSYSKLKNEYHLREYTPEEFRDLIAWTGKRYAAWTSDAYGQITRLDNIGLGKNNYGILIRVQS